MYLTLTSSILSGAIYSYRFRSILSFYSLPKIIARSTKLSSLRFWIVSLSARFSSKKCVLIPTPLLPVACYSSRAVPRVEDTVALDGLKHTAIMSTTTANNGDDEVRSKPQQSPLASQRGKADNTSADSAKTGRTGGYFTLGYKEGFSQWVSRESQGK